MKVIINIVFSLLLLNFLPPIILANEIDSIKTNEDVNIFMEKYFGDKYIDFSVADTNYIWYYHTNKIPYRKIADSLGMKFWYKTDFNMDNKTDLLVYGSVMSGTSEHSYKYTSIFGVIESDSGLYQIKPFHYRMGKAFPVIVNDTQPLIVLYQTIESDFLYQVDSTYNIGVSYDEVFKSIINDKPYVYVDTLIYKFEAFIEYNSNPKPKRIRELYFENDCGQIACYVMKVTVTEDRNATMIGGEYYENKIFY